MTESTAIIKLQNSAVNSGTAVNLNGASFEYKIVKLSNVEPAPGKHNIVSVNNQGYENPTIRISGYVDADGVLANTVTKELLTSFVTATTQNYLIIRYGSIGTEQELTNIDNTNATIGADAAIKIVIKDVTIRSVQGARNGHVLSFDINAIEDL